MLWDGVKLTEIANLGLRIHELLWIATEEIGGLKDYGLESVKIGDNYWGVEMNGEFHQLVANCELFVPLFLRSKILSQRFFRAVVEKKFKYRLLVGGQQCLLKWGGI